MRAVEYTTRFKRDYKREVKGKHRAILGGLFVEIVDALTKDELLALRYHDHVLSNNWHGYRDCHIKSDLVFLS